jgi:hypothetical protein
LEEKHEVLPRTGTVIAQSSELLEPSAIARDLIHIRDPLFSLSSGSAVPSPAVLQVLYQKLGKMLEKEVVTALEETGAHNDGLQEVSATEIHGRPRPT